MNIVDKILVDPITRGLKFFTKGGVPAYVSQVRGRTDGSAPAAGYVGEVLTFTTRAVTATTSYASNASALTTLTPGIWVIYSAIGNPAGAHLIIGALISTNSSNDATGSIGNDTQSIADATYGTTLPLIAVTMNVSTNTPIYAKAVTGATTAVVNISGVAVRVG